MRTIIFITVFSLGSLLWAGCSVKPVEKPMDADCIVSRESISEKTPKEFDLDLLARLSKELYELSGSASCQPGDEWGIAPIGIKPCGGPAAYIAYKKYREECFLKKLAYYNQQSQFYITKYQLASDCAVVPQPKSVTCEGGKPVFVW